MSKGPEKTQQEKHKPVDLNKIRRLNPESQQKQFEKQSRKPKKETRRERLQRMRAKKREGYRLIHSLAHLEKTNPLLYTRVKKNFPC